MFVEAYTSGLFVKTKPLSILYSIAEHYAQDARDFAERFDILWEKQLHKTGRIKSFVDLMMACECGLKAHVALGRVNEDPTEVYKMIRRASHRIEPLAQAATFLSDRSTYDELTSRLDSFSVFIRYSLEAYDTFFPLLVERDDAKLNYSQTVGNNRWVLEVRRLLEPLLASVSEELAGFVTDDIKEIFAHERQMQEFMETFKK